MTARRGSWTRTVAMSASRSESPPTPTRDMTGPVTGRHSSGWPCPPAPTSDPWSGASRSRDRPATAPSRWPTRSQPGRPAAITSPCAYVMWDLACPRWTCRRCSSSRGSARPTRSGRTSCQRPSRRRCVSRWSCGPPRSCPRSRPSTWAWRRAGSGTTSSRRTEAAGSVPTWSCRTGLMACGNGGWLSGLTSGTRSTRRCIVASFVVNARTGAVTGD